MARLVLDLDLTVWAALQDEASLDKRYHQLSEPGSVMLGSNPMDVQIINAQWLVELINYACDHHDGVIFLTAGAWDAEDTLDYLLFALDGLSAKAQEMLSRAPVITPINTEHLYKNKNLDWKKIRLLPKNERFLTWLEYSGQTLCKKGDHFVFVDDYPAHIDSYGNNPNAHGVLATTCTKDIDALNLIRPLEFYETAMVALILASYEEQHQAAVQAQSSMVADPRLFAAPSSSTPPTPDAGPSEPEGYDRFFVNPQG